MNRLMSVGALALSVCAPGALAQVTDPGFEGYAVADGDYLRDNSGPWTFFNDASVVDPFAPNSSNGALQSWSATFAPYEGEQYACTYAGTDTITQSVFLQGGVDYTISVYAAAPDGDLSYPGVGVLPLVDGGFEFTVDGSGVSAENVLSPGTDWTYFSTVVNASGSGMYEIGVHNTRTASYFINYDEFTVVPAPGAAAACLAFASLGLTRRRRG